MEHLLKSHVLYTLIISANRHRFWHFFLIVQSYLLSYLLFFADQKSFQNSFNMTVEQIVSSSARKHVSFPVFFFYCLGCGLNFSTQTILQGGLATFEIRYDHTVRFYHLPELREQKFIAELFSPLFFVYEDDSYKGRLHSTGNDSYSIITLNGIQAQDSGTYFATTEYFATTPLCFQVTVIGELHISTSMTLIPPLLKYI